MRLNISILIYALLFLVNISVSQGLYLNSTEVTIQNAAQVTIQGDLISESNSTIDNLGSIRLRDDLINDGGNVLFSNQTGGTVFLYGNDQLISGNDSTVFFNLNFNGNNFSTKSFLTSSAVLNELDINNQILQTNDHRVYLLNSSANSLFFGDGFIASDVLGGYFVRSTASTDEYVFPVGAINLTPYYRAVSITPLTNQDNLFEVRLAPLGADIDNSGTSATGAIGPFDLSLKSPDLGVLNESYYHNIHRLNGSSEADIDVFFSSADGGYSTLAQWKSSQFENPVDEVNPANFLGLDQVVSLKIFNDYNDDIFVLAEADTTSVPEEPCADFFFPSIFSPNEDGNNDLLCVYWGCLEDMHLSILNRWGEIVFETMDPMDCWDGTQKGQPLNAGIFVYMIHALDSETGEEVSLSGNLTLVR